MMAVKKVFSLRTVLSVTTDRLLTDNGISDIYELLSHATGDICYDFQIGRFADEVRTWLYRWFPELAMGEACLHKLDGWISKDRTGTALEGIKMWLAELKILDPRIQDQYSIGQIPKKDHRHINPIAEADAMIAKDRERDL